MGTMTFGTLTAFLQIIQQIKAPFRNVSGLIPQYYSMQASAERLMELEAMIDEQAESKILDAQKFYKEFHAIVAEKVTFSYAGGEPVLENTFLRVQKGDLIAIVGESGIGKSTLMKLLLHLILATVVSCILKLNVAKWRLMRERELYSLMFRKGI